MGHAPVQATVCSVIRADRLGTHTLLAGTNKHGGEGSGGEGNGDPFYPLEIEGVSVTI